MEYQIVNEIAQFWRTLVPPIFLGMITLFLFLWFIGKENRFKLMKRFIEHDTGQYVCQNGIDIPKNLTIRHLFIQKVLIRSGFESIKPLTSIFLIILLFFGFHQIVLLLFQPMLITFSSGSALYASGIDDYTIAYIWSHYPHVNSLGHIFDIIMDLTKDAINDSQIFKYSLESYIRFNLCFYVVVYFILLWFKFKKKAKWITKRIFERVFIMICMLFLCLCVTFVVQIQDKNKEIRRRCQIVYEDLVKNDEINPSIFVKTGQQNQVIDKYLELIEYDKKECSDSLYYGAYGIESRIYEFFYDLSQEVIRLIS